MQSNKPILLLFPPTHPSTFPPSPPGIATLLLGLLLVPLLQRLGPLLLASGAGQVDPKVLSLFLFISLLPPPPSPHPHPLFSPLLHHCFHNFLLPPTQVFTASAEYFQVRALAAPAILLNALAVGALRGFSIQPPTHPPTHPLHQVFTASAEYFQVRALAAPAILLNALAVGALRGFLDTTTPLLVVSLAFLFDYTVQPQWVRWLLPSKGRWVGG